MLLGVLLALGAAVIVIYVVSSAVGPSSNLTTVVVAAEDLTPGSELVSSTSNNAQGIPISTAFTTTKVNAGFVPADAYTFTTTTQLDIDLADQVVVGQFFKGDILRKPDSRLVSAGSAATGSLTLRNPGQLPAGSVIFPLPVDKVSGLVPGDHVDILVTVCVVNIDPNSGQQTGSCNGISDITQTTLQNVYVYAVGSDVVDLVLTHQQALDLKFLAEHGKISIALRKPGDDAPDATSPVTGPYILGQFKFQ
jgi:Flp pilus assembly protein CpaB